MRYYVQKTHKPKDRAALALAVDVGSIAETEEERGAVSYTHLTLPTILRV